MSGTRVLTVVTLDSGDEAIYLDGRLKTYNSTIYACDIAEIAGDEPIIFQHVVRDGGPPKWPDQLE